MMGFEKASCVIPKVREDDFLRFQREKFHNQEKNHSQAFY